MKANAGKYLLVVEGSIPTKDGGVYCKIAGETMLEITQEAAEHAAAIISFGSCASWVVYSLLVQIQLVQKVHKPYCPAKQ